MAEGAADRMGFLDRARIAQAVDKHDFELTAASFNVCQARLIIDEIKVDLASRGINPEEVEEFTSLAALEEEAEAEIAEEVEAVAQGHPIRPADQQVKDAFSTLIASGVFTSDQVLEVYGRWRKGKVETHGTG